MRRPADTHRAAAGVPARRRHTRRLAAAALFATVLAAASTAAALAQTTETAETCSAIRPCIMVVQIAGLEPKDVTEATTPFIWGLAQPGPGSAADPIMGAGRNGFMWQAPRASMTAGKAANTASLLTGGYPEQTGIPADEFIGSSTGRVRLGAPEASLESQPLTAATALQVDSLYRLIEQDRSELDMAAIVGDPALAPLAADVSDVGSPDRVWTPAPNETPPTYCPTPRNPDPSAAGDSQAALVGCPAPDAQTLNQAFGILSAQTGSDVGFSFIHLAEVGEVKRRSSDVDSAPESQDPSDPTTPAAALANTDAALATFFGRLRNDAALAAKLDSTIVMVLGDSGFEQTLPDRRVPDPDDAGEDLEHLVEKDRGTFSFELIPQGTIATVYCESGGCPTEATAPSAAYKAALAALKTDIESVNTRGECASPTGPCIAEVLYMRPELAPAGSAETVPAAHPSWHLDHKKFDETTFEPTDPIGTSGDLIVHTRPGWGLGKAAPTDDDTINGGESVTNPYNASTGGPRNRAVAALINGPAAGNAVVQADPSLSSGGRFPVTTTDTPGATEFNPACDDNKAAPRYTGNGVGPANAAPGDDANAEGNLCQAEIVDFAPTIASLLEVSVPPEQLAGRLLNEAFTNDLVPTIDLPPPPPPPTAFFTAGPVSGEGYKSNKKLRALITDRTPTFEFTANIPLSTFECNLDDGGWFACESPHTTAELSFAEHTFKIRATGEGGLGDVATAFFEVLPTFDFNGLLGKVSVHVADRFGRSLREARPGARLSRLAIETDFGKDVSLVELAFYHRRRGVCGKKVDQGAEVERLGSARAARRAPQAVSGGRKGKKGKGKGKKGKGKKGECKIVAVARFDPFTLTRGHVALRLKVPKHFRGERRPDYVGLLVHEARPLDSEEVAKCERRNERKETSLQCEHGPLGEPAGGIFKVGQGNKLHKRKPRDERGGKKKGKSRAAGARRQGGGEVGSHQ